MDGKKKLLGRQKGEDRKKKTGFGLGGKENLRGRGWHKNLQTFKKTNQPLRGKKEREKRQPAAQAKERTESPELAEEKGPGCSKNRERGKKNKAQKKKTCGLKKRWGEGPGKEGYKGAKDKGGGKNVPEIPGEEGG